MKKISFILNVILLIVVIVLAVKVVPCNSKDGAKSNATYATIMTRTSVRDYQSDKPVEKEKIDTLLHAAMAAPTAVNKQPWIFVVLQDRAVIDELADSLQHAQMLKKAPLAILICGDKTKFLEGEGEGFWIQDVSAATENLLLAAHSMGLGAVWTGVYPAQERVDIIKTVLSLPDNIIPLSLVPVGYPNGDQQPKDKWNPDNVKYNKWK